MSEAEKRRRGRPRTIPTGAKPRAVFLTDEEWEGLVLDAAAATGGTRNDWMRRVVLRAASRTPRKGRSK